MILLNWGYVFWKTNKNTPHNNPSSHKTSEGLNRLPLCVNGTLQTGQPGPDFKYFTIQSLQNPCRYHPRNAIMTE